MSVWFSVFECWRDVRWVYCKLLYDLLGLCCECLVSGEEIVWCGCECWWSVWGWWVLRRCCSLGFWLVGGFLLRVSPFLAKKLSITAYWFYCSTDYYWAIFIYSRRTGLTFKEGKMEIKEMEGNSLQSYYLYLILHNVKWPIHHRKSCLHLSLLQAIHYPH